MKSQFLKTLTLAVILLGLTTSPLFAQLGIKSVGSVQKKDGPMQVTVVFSEPVDPATAGVAGNYSLGAGVTINTASMMTGLPGLNEPGNGDGSLRGRVIDNQCVVLEVTGLGTTQTTLTATGITAGGGAQTFTGSQAFVPSGYFWAELATLYAGHREGKVISDSTNGFDIFNNGRTGWSTEDEFTFAYKPVTGDFDFKSRIEFQDFASRWSRAGIMVRESVDDGAADGCFGRYVTSHTDPVTAWTSNDAGEVAGTRAGNNTYESNYRLTHYRAEYPVCGDGSRALSAGGNDTAGNGGGTPEYPQAWLRLVRAGDIITAYYSNDGQNWSGEWVRDFSGSANGALPATMYLGPMYCAEWGNINPLNVGARERYYLTQHRWGPLTTPYVQRIDGNPFGFVATVKNSMTAMVPGTLQLTLDGASVTATSVVGPDVNGVTTITYTSSTILTPTSHTVVVQFNDNGIPPNTIIKQSTFTLSYVSIPEGYATTTFSGTKGNMMVSAHKMPIGPDGITQLARGLGDNTVAAAETELQDGFLFPGTSNPVVSDVDVTPVELAGVVNHTQSPLDAGFFNANNPDVNGQIWDVSPMPNFVDGNNYALQFYGYAELPVGSYRMFVNSDDGFKLSFGPNALDVIAPSSGAFNGGRGMTLNGDPAGFDVVITRAGVYPFRLIFEQGGGDASIEWYMLNAAGNRVLINDATAPVKTYPNGRGRAYVKKFLPYPGSNGTSERPTLTFEVVNDLTTIDDNSIRLVLDGTDVSSSVTKARVGTTLTVTYTPPQAYAFASRHTGEFGYTESNGTNWTHAIDFTVKGFTPADLPADSFWIEIEDYNYNSGQVVAEANTMPYAGGAYTGLIGVVGTDFNDTEESGGGIVDYRGGTTGGPAISVADNMGGRYGSSRPGPFTMTANYKIGWIGSGNWYNYTRQIPAGLYTAYLAISIDPANSPEMRATLDRVTNPTQPDAQQVKTRVGTFRAPSSESGAWSENALAPLYAADGSQGVFKVVGAEATTLRVNGDQGDLDWFTVVRVIGVPPKVTSAYPAQDALAARDDTVRLTVEDFSTTVVQNSVKLYFDNVDVTTQATVTKPADITTVTYDPTGVMSIGAHSYRLEFRDSASALFTNTINFTAVALGVPNQFLIEAEDFNTGGGQTVAGASTMPYTGNLYNGLNATFDVDYHSTENMAPDNSGGAGWTAVYRSGAPITPDTEMPLNDNLGGRLGQMRGATWQMTVNYKIGWTGGSDWANYTRNIPNGNYEVYAALSGDTGATPIAGALDVVTSDITQPNQATTRLGVFSAPATGGWGNNVMVPMTESGTGSPKVISLGTPPTTLRFYPQNGDFDFLVLQPSSAAPAPTIDVATNPQGQPVLTFTGALLLSADTITGPYLPVAGATSPFTVTGAGTGNKFYRTSNP